MSHLIFHNLNLKLLALHAVSIVIDIHTVFQFFSYANAFDSLKLHVLQCSFMIVAYVLIAQNMPCTRNRREDFHTSKNVELKWAQRLLLQIQIK